MRSDAEVWKLLQEASHVAIVGSRNAPDDTRKRVAYLIGILDPEATVVTGGALGVDTWAEELAVERGLTCAIVRPSRKGSHLAADYFRRNDVIVRGAEIVVAFWDGQSRGTLDSINKAIADHGFCVVVVDDDKPSVWRLKIEIG